MIQCTACGRPIEKVPDWLRTAKAEFICNNCPNRQMKNIAFVDLSVEAPSAKVPDEAVVDAAEIADDEPAV